MKKPRVAIFSCFDRGQWLAAALSEKNYEVKLFDVSHFMGRWTPEDWEGPFGLFHLESLTQLQNERISEQDYFETVDEGLVLWLKDGPLELKGPLALYNMESLGLRDSYEKLLSYYKSGHWQDLKQYVESESFDKTWLIYFATFLAANHYQPGDFSLETYKDILTLTSPYSIRRSTRKGLEKSLQWCESKGVQCYRDVEIKDISTIRKNCDSVEVTGPWSGVVDADYYVWMLTGEETLRFDESVVVKLFPQGILNSEWAWVRYRFALDNKDLYSSLPLKFIIIDDIYLPWTHDNLIIVQKGVSQGDMDVFVRVPTHHRFHKQYLENMADKLYQALFQRLPTESLKISDLPQDYHYTMEDLGPPRFPIYDTRKLRRYTHRKFKNLFFSSPEFWSPQDLSRQFKFQEEIIERIGKLDSERAKSSRQTEVEL